MAEVLISNLDVGNLLFLQPNDHSNVPIERCNVIVLGWILGSLSQELYLGQVYSEITSEVWSELQETYDKMDGSNLLAREPLPEVNDAFAIVSREESYRGFVHGIQIVKNTLATLYPAGFKINPNLSRQYGYVNFFNGNAYMSQIASTSSGSMSSSFTNDQLMKLLSLINEKPAAANVSCSILNLTVGHPNGTIAKITAIGSLRLTDNVVLFDVLVVPEYNVSLLSFNKIIKDRTGSESAGLYMFDCADNGKNNLGENVTSEGNGQNVFHGEGSSIIGNEPQTKVRRSTRQKTLPVKFHYFVVSSNVRYGLEKYVCWNGYLGKGQKRSQNYKTEHENEKSVKQKSKSKPKVKVKKSTKVKPQKLKVKDEDETEEILNGPPVPI
ncbi:hypothetical protein Tco_0663255 [Tanacetum coccineum]